MALATGIIEIATSGFEKAKGLINSLKANFLGLTTSLKGVQAETDKAGKTADDANSKFAKLSSTIGGIGSFATRSFAMATAGMGALVRMAAPYEFQQLTVALAGVSIQLGRFFIPLVRDLTGWLVRLSNYLRSLTDETRANVLWITKVGLALLVGTIAFSKLFSIITTGITVVRAFSAVMTVMMAASPIGAILAIAAALGGLFAMIDGQGGGFSGMFGSLMPALQGMLAMVKDIFAKIVPVLMGLFESVMRVLTPIIEFIVVVVAERLMPMVSIVVDLFSIIVSVLTPFIEVIGIVVEVLGAVLTPIFKVMQIPLQAIALVLRLLSPIFTQMAANVRAVASVIHERLKPMLDLLAEAFRWARDTMIDALNAIIRGVNKFLSYVPGSSYIGGDKDYQISKDGPGSAPSPAANNANNQFTGTVNQQMSLSSISEAWKKAQTTNPNDPSLQIQSLQLNQAEQQTQALQQIQANTSGGIAGGLAGAMGGMIPPVVAV